MVKNIAVGAGGLGLIPGPLNRAQCRQQLATAANFFRNCVTKHYAAEMSPTTRYTLRRNTANVMKNFFGPKNVTSPCSRYFRVIFCIGFIRPTTIA